MNISIKNKMIATFAGVILIVVGFLVFVMWNTGAVYLRDYSNTTVLFNPDDFSIPAELKNIKSIRVVHFWDPKCPCNEEPDSHLRDLISLHNTSNIKFYRVQKPDSTGDIAPFLRDVMQPLDKVEGMQLLPASPSLVIWDENDNLAYAGPYSEGVTCNSNNSFVEPVLEALVAGRKISVPGTIAVGCYCDWLQ